MELFRMLGAAQGGAEPKDEGQRVEEGEQVVIEGAMTRAKDVYRVSDDALGLKLVLRQAPSWLLGVERTYRVTVDGDEWSVVVGAARKTYATARVGKHRFYIDTARTPQPGFRRVSLSKFVTLEQVTRVVAAINAALPRWRAELGDAAVTAAQSRAEWKATRLQLAEEAPLRIASVAKSGAKGPYLKTKLASAPAWLLEATTRRVPFDLDGERWCIRVERGVRMHVDAGKRRIVINPQNQSGFTRGVDAALLARLGDAFNAQAPALQAAAQRFAEQSAAFDTAAALANGEHLRVATLAKRLLHVRVAEAPQWLIDCGKTFYVSVGDEIWECSWSKRGPSVDAAAQRLALGSGVFKTTLAQATLDALVAAVDAALPAWQQALAAQRGADKAHRRDALQRHGPIKRQRIDLQAALDALASLDEV